MCKTIAKGEMFVVLQTKSFVAFVSRILKFCGLARRASMDELSPAERRPPSAFSTVKLAAYAD
jgi:hypothetical protein